MNILDYLLISLDFNVLYKNTCVFEKIKKSKRKLLHFYAKRCIIYEYL